ncbi:MAG: TOBE domain-containing protein [Desulfovibrio sp.]|nr:TOBE domain-containing protein [Desulfovibrio sp.]
MEKNKNREEMAALLRTLSSADRAWLRQRLMRRDSTALLQDTGRISARELLAVESWLWEKASVARGPREKRPRLRMWLIFMLLRYAALRLVEIFSLKPSHMDLQEGIVRVPASDGSHGREVPLPLTISRRLRRVLEDPALFPESQELMRCDASYVRRCLQQCGAACGLPKGLLSARALRHSRALELGRQGLPLPVVDIFLGRRAAPGQSGIVRCDPQEARRLLREQLQRERPMKTSARNVFQGRITSLRQTGILVEVVLRTAGGLRIVSLITDESCRTLALAEGKLVNASVKAPWVLVTQGELPKNTSAPAENCFVGVVERIRDDSMVAEVVIALPEGSLVCAIQSCGQDSSPALKAGQKVTVLFKSFSVILNLD